jgi:hypothetical protein
MLAFFVTYSCTCKSMEAPQKPPIRIRYGIPFFSFIRIFYICLIKQLHT